MFTALEHNDKLKIGMRNSMKKKKKEKETRKTEKKNHNHKMKSHF